MSIRLLLPLSILALMSVRCSMPDDVKAAKDTSKDMDGKLDVMVDKSDSLVDRTSNLFYGARKDLGFERPTARYKDILEADGDSTKILYATAFSRSYSFQQWTGTKTDDLALKERQYADAMEDLLARFESLIGHNYSPDLRMPVLSFLPDTPNNSWKSLASVAVTLGEIDQDQAIASAKAGVRTESLYSLIVKGLQYRKKSLFTEIPQYARLVLRFEGEAVMLLQMRHNYFEAMVMSRFTDFCSGNYPRVNEVLSWLKLATFGIPVDIRYVDNIVKVQDEAVLWLQQARETQQVLEMLGHKVEFNKGIQDIFSGVKFEKPQNWVGYPVVESTWRDLDTVVGDLQKTYQTGKAAKGTVPAHLIEPKAALTEEEAAFVAKKTFKP